MNKFLKSLYIYLIVLISLIIINMLLLFIAPRPYSRSECTNHIFAQIISYKKYNYSNNLDIRLNDNFKSCDDIKNIDETYNLEILIRNGDSSILKSVSKYDNYNRLRIVILNSENLNFDELDNLTVSYISISNATPNILNELKKLYGVEKLRVVSDKPFDLSPLKDLNGLSHLYVNSDFSDYGDNQEILDYLKSHGCQVNN